MIDNSMILIKAREYQILIKTREVKMMGRETASFIRCFKIVSKCCTSFIVSALKLNSFCHGGTTPIIAIKLLISLIYVHSFSKLGESI